MRWIGRSLLAAALLCSLWFVVIPTVSERWQALASTTADLEQAHAITFFPLDRQRWLTFDVPQNAEIFRIYSHAAVRTGIPEKSVSYIIDYQWLDQDLDVLEEKQHHITTLAGATVTPLSASPGADTRIEARFYDHERSRPSRDHALYFAADKQPAARALRLRVNSMDADIVEVGIRPFQRYQRSARDLDIAWHRMSSTQRDTLSKGSLYPSFLLSGYERKNLLSSFWKPVGPLGVLDKDYQIKTLYHRDTIAPALPPQTPAADGVFAGPDHTVTLALQEAEGRYRVEWQSLPQLDAPLGLTLQWQGVDLKQQRQWRTALEQSFWEGSIGAGLLQLTSDQPAMLKFFHWQENAWRDISPEKLYSRPFYCSAGAALEYALAPGADSQSLKIDARDYIRQDQPESMARAKISLQLFDENAAPVYGETLELSTLNNPYQQFYDAASVPSRVFEPTTRYLDAAPNAHTLHISCDGPSLISVYSRPWRHPVQRSLPADENRLHAYQQREPAWFLLQPENLDALIRQKRLGSLVWYFKPRGLDSMVSQGYYNRQALVTDDPGAPEWQVFSNHESNSQARMEARSNAFQPLAAAATLFFAGRSNEKLVRPSAVYLREQAEPQPVQVWIDHVLALETSIVGYTGRVRLPYLDAGRHHVEIRSKATRWYINNTAETGQTHFLRSAYSMPPAGKGSSLTFNIATSGSPQQLGFWLFVPGDAEVLNCRLQLLAQRTDTLQHSHSLLDYNYELRSGEYEKSFVLQRKENVVRGPIRLVMGLDADLPAQTATARLNCDQPGVLASAGIISPGLSVFRVFEEPNEA